MNDQDFKKLSALLDVKIKQLKQDFYDDFATKGDIDLVKEKIPSQLAISILLKNELRKFATKEEVSRFVTKKELELVKSVIIKAIDTSSTDVIEDLAKIMHEYADILDKKKADKSQTFPLEVRVENIERKVFPQ